MPFDVIAQHAQKDVRSHTWCAIVKEWPGFSRLEKAVCRQTPAGRPTGRVMPAPEKAGLSSFLRRDTVPDPAVLATRDGLPRRLACCALPLDRLLGAPGERLDILVRAMIIARLTAPASKLATAKALSLATAASSLAPVLSSGEVDAEELYAPLDWLLEQHPQIEAALAKRHLKDGSLVLYEVSSSWLEGRCCPLAQFGHSWAGKPNKL